MERKSVITIFFLFYLYVFKMIIEIIYLNDYFKNIGWSYSLLEVFF